MSKPDINESVSILGFMENCIVETLLMTSNLDGSPNIAPMGITRHGNHLIVKAYKTSQTYENLKRGDSVSIYVSSDPLLFLKTAFKQEFDPQPELDKADSVIQVETIGQVYEDALRASFKLKPTNIEIKSTIPKVFSRGRASAIDLIINTTRLQIHAEEKREPEANLIIDKMRQNIEIIDKVSTERTAEQKVVEAIKALSMKWGVDL